MGKIDNLGKRIANSKGYLNVNDLAELQEYRKSFKDPLAEVFETLRRIAIRVDSNSIVTYRIKRINTIINKLRRFADNPKGRMSLSSIGDIAGCRCILETEQQVYRVRDLIVKEYGANVLDCDKHDYIKSPKADGYRSLHLYVKDMKTNKKVEIQLRTTEQHNWATLVEITDLIYNTKIKEGGEEKRQLKRFLFLFSNKNNLGKPEIKELIRIERRNEIYKRMCDVFRKNYLSVRKQWLRLKRRECYYVIEAGSDLKSILENYDNYEDAEKAYYDKYISNKESNIVLTYIKDAKFNQLSKAYANYILTVHAFFEDYRTFIEGSVIEAISKESVCGLWRCLGFYRKITVLFVNNIKEELLSLEESRDEFKKQKSRMKKWEKELRDDIKKWRESTRAFMKKQSKSYARNRILYCVAMIQYKILNHQLR